MTARVTARRGSRCTASLWDVGACLRPKPARITMRVQSSGPGLTTGLGHRAVVFAEFGSASSGDVPRPCGLPRLGQRGALSSGDQ